MNKISSLAVGMGMSVLSALASAQSLQNGNFEEGPVTIPGNVDVCPLYWSCATSVSVVNQTEGTPINNYNTSPDGGRMADFFYLSTGARTLSQDITSLVVGQAYTLTFQEAIQNSDPSIPAGSAGYTVSVGGQTVTTTQMAIPQDAMSTWATVSANFIATAATETLQFLASANVPVQPEPTLELDAVTVTQQPVVVNPVPEPGSYALMLAGLGVIAVLVQRRRKL